MIFKLREMKIEHILGIISTGAQVISAVFIGYLTFLTLRFMTKPKLKMTLLTNIHEGDFVPDQAEKILIYIENIGRWYGRPAATNVKLYVNFPPAFDPVKIKFGSRLEKIEKNVGRGKGNSKYLIASGIHLFSGEPGEEIEVEVKMPNKAGNYYFWVAAYSDQGDFGAFCFDIPATDLSKWPVSIF